MTELPDYADLPPAPRGGRSAWGLFGTGDNLGLVNLMTPERIAAAARLVRRGQVFCLEAHRGRLRVPMEQPRDGDRLGHLCRRGLPGRPQPSSAPVRVLAQHAHRPARDGPGRTLVA